jgi:hypothetical protein
MPLCRRVVVLVALTLSTAAMPRGMLSGQSPVDRTTLRQALTNARTRWDAHKPPSYEFVLSVPVSSRDWWSRRFAGYRVTDGSGATLAPPTGSLANVFQGRQTVDALFDLIGERLESAPAPVSVRYDEELGYPTAASLGEVSFSIQTFRVFSQASDVAEPFVLLQHVNHCGTRAIDPTVVGPCPDYSIAMWGDGTVVYLGDAGVRVLGRHQHQVAPDAVRSLRQAVGTSRFFDLGDDYSSFQSGELRLSIDHAAEQWLTVRFDGRQKTVHDFIGAPDELRVFESTIETLTDSHRYTGRDKGQ